MFIATNSTTESLVKKVESILNQKQEESNVKLFFKGKEILFSNKLLKDIGVMPYNTLLVLNS